MPGFDGSGPEGKGSMTGRRRGYCRPSSNSAQQVPASEDNINADEGIYRRRLFSGRGLGRRMGRGPAGR